MSDWDRILASATARALARIRIEAPDEATAHARERQAYESYSDAVIDGDHTLLRRAERDAWRQYINENFGGDEEWTWPNMRA